MVHKKIETRSDYSAESTGPDGERESNEKQTEKLSQVVCLWLM